MHMLMFRRLGALAAVLCAALAWPAAAVAQNPSLAEIARKEQERRKATKSSDKVLTNKDLPPSAVKAPPPAADAGAAKPAGDQQAAETSAGGKDEKNETWWRQRITQARETLRRNESFLEALQSRVNALSADFVNRDDPYQRAKIGEDRQKALAEMERVKAEIALSGKEIADIEEEARKAGVPPGWLR